MKKVFIFGAGNLYKKYRDSFDKFEVLGILDNFADVTKEIDGFKVFRPEQVKDCEFDYIIITIKSYKEPLQQLKDLGISENKILTPDSQDFHTQLRTVTYIENKPQKTGEKNILLFSHVLQFSGAPLCLVKMGEILLAGNCNVTIASGEILDENFIEKNNQFNYMIFNDIEFSESEIKEYFSKFDYVVINTIALWKLVNAFGCIDNPAAWWIHEDEGVWGNYLLTENCVKPYAKLQIWGMGKRVINAYNKFSPCELPIKELRWGIDEIPFNTNESHSKIRIITAGTYLKIKGQDILLNVIKKHINDWNDKLEVYYAGSFPHEIKDQMEKNPINHYMGVLTHEELLKMYDSVDVVCCPSRNESMSMTVVEGLMKHRVCLVSTGAGVSEYLNSFHNGLVFENDNELDLENKITWIIENRKLLKNIGENGFLVYKSNFSADEFEKRVYENILQQILF